MEIILKESKIQFKNPVIGQPTRAIEAHYYARRITALVDGVERQFRFMANELPFDATEDDMILAIENYIINEQSNQN